MMKQFYSAIVIVLLFVASTNGDLYDLTEEVPEKYTSKHRSSRYNKPTKSSYIQDEEKSDSYEPDEQESDSYEPDEQESDSDEPDKQESDSYESDESESESYESNEPTSYASKTPSSYVPKKPSTYTPTKPTDDYVPEKSGIEYEFLVPQNAARAAVGLSPLVWDSTLATYAQYWANERKMDCALEHSHGNYGENIFWGSSSDFSASKAASEWIAEQSNYNYGDNSCSGEMCGHYTQIVWKSTTKVGCAKVDCFYGQGVFMVCSYDPAGNVLGEKPY